jgi:hypothetical protein
MVRDIYGAVHLEPAYFVQNFPTCKINLEFISFSGNAPFDERNSSSEQFFNWVKIEGVSISRLVQIGGYDHKASLCPVRAQFWTQT